jgi:hypothetical protein
LLSSPGGQALLVPGLALRLIKNFVSLQQDAPADVILIPRLTQSRFVACKRTATPQPAFRQTMKIAKFNFKIFLIATIICSILTFVTLIAAAARDEGTGGDGIIVKVLEKLFYIFRFPTHTLFFQFMNGSMFIVGLFLNCLFYGLLVERVFAFKKKNESKL